MFSILNYLKHKIIEITLPHNKKHFSTEFKNYILEYIRTLKEKNKDIKTSEEDVLVLCLCNLQEHFKTLPNFFKFMDNISDLIEHIEKLDKETLNEWVEESYQFYVQNRKLPVPQ